MIARFFFLLPFDLCITEASDWPTLNVLTGEHQIRVHPPLFSVDRPRATDTVASRALWSRKVAPASFTENVLVGGQKIASANVLIVDFIKPEFDRSRVRMHTQPDPPPELAFEAANMVLSKVRVFSRAAQIRPLAIGCDPWDLLYLSDDSQMIAEEQGKNRGKGTFPVTIGCVALSPETIRMVAAQTAEPYVWDELLLDAQALGAAGNIGSAIVIAYAALETFSAWALDILQKQRPLPNGLWDWIKKRDHWSKEPSTREEFDTLLQAFTGRSLKNEPQLWQGFQELRSARNALVHEGVAKVGNESVGRDKTRALIDAAEKVVAWVELLLPEPHRRARKEAVGPFARKFATVSDADALGLKDRNVQFTGLASGFRLEIEPSSTAEDHSPAAQALDAKQDLNGN
jgi:hypothetical protein